MMSSMLILRGVKHLLDVPSATAYAIARGYGAHVLGESGEAFTGSPQYLVALQTIRTNTYITALYGFSGGGYNLRHVLDDLTDEEKKRIKLVVVLGAPNNPKRLYEGPWELVYRTDPPTGHMDGPRVLLKEYDEEKSNETPHPN